MKFKYKKIPDNTNPRGYASLPLLQVRLFYGSKYQDVLCLIDSGADDCIFHSSLGRLLGIDITSGRLKQFFGIAGQCLGAYIHPVQLQIQGFSQQIDLEAAFTEDNKIPLLGQSGFFDNYQIIFERYKGRFEIKGRTSRVLR